MALKNSQKIVIGIVAFIVLLISWGLYPLFFKWLMIGIGTDKVDLVDFGSLGDIYGSLTALFTSATLLIVLYSAFLQREANKDAREAMANQLQQARDATAKQLTQARKALREQLKQAETATQQQIDNAQALSDLQLKHAKEVAIQQLELVQKNHDAQMLESGYAIFSNMFYSFLNQKNEILRRLCIGKNGEISSNDLFEFLSENFVNTISQKFNEKSISDKDIENTLFDIFMDKIDEYGNNGNTISSNSVYSYFYTYRSLIELIQKSNIKENDKDLFMHIVSNSMSNDEQICLIWMVSFTVDLRTVLISTRFFDAEISSKIMPFIVKNMDISYFRNLRVLDKWEKYIE